MLTSPFVIAFQEIGGSIRLLSCFPQLCLVILLSFNFFASYLTHGQYISAPGQSGNLTIFPSHKTRPALMMTAWPPTKVLLLVILAGYLS